MKVKTSEPVYDLTSHGIPIIDDFFELLDYLDIITDDICIQYKSMGLDKSRNIYVKYTTMYIYYDKAKMFSIMAVCLNFFSITDGARPIIPIPSETVELLLNN